ncbi:MAG: deoxyribodipyrimidine photolyase [Pirellulaceae bacterium]
MSDPFPESRFADVNSAPIREIGDYVLYWMIANRRTRWNFSFQRAAKWAEKLGKPLVVFEALRVDYPWASDRLHTFVIQGMRDNACDLADSPVLYYPHIEPEAGAARGLLKSLSQRACVVVTDDFPCFFLPRMVELTGKRLDVRLEKVDSNGLLPMRAADKTFTTAYSFRRFLQKNLSPHLERLPELNPLAGRAFPAAENDLIQAIQKKWPPATQEAFNDPAGYAEQLPIDHEVSPVLDCPGGAVAAEKTLGRFLQHRLDRYADHRNEVEQEVVSGISPYLHFGHLSAHQVFQEVAELASWDPSQLSTDSKGSRTGWWNMSPNAESFLDELITWRELGFNMCHREKNFDQFESLPDWALKTLAEHREDQRTHVYSLEEFEQARTHDEIWNAAQRQLISEGRIHNYLRMLWGKKVLHWSASPQEASRILIELNNKYALDGRNPNSYSGIFWCFGRYDRAWGPEREIFGKIRYMSSQSARRKLSLKGYLSRYGENRLFT